MAQTSPAFITIMPRGLPVFLSWIRQWISSDSWKNHSLRSLPWITGSMCSSEVTQQIEVLVTAVTEGFQVTSEREMWSNRLMACSWPSKPGSTSTSGLSNSTSAKARLTGVPVLSERTGWSPGRPSMRLAGLKLRSSGPSIGLPLEPMGLPVSSGARSGS